MRFGIMSMQSGALFPTDLSAQETLAHVGQFDHAGLARELWEQGFDPIELGGDLILFLPHTFAKPAIERLLQLKEEVGLTYTVHLPLWSVEPSTPLEPVRQGSTRALIDAIHAVEPLQPEVHVLHATGPLAAEFTRMDLPDMARAFALSQFQNQARRSLQEILDATGLPSRQLAIETIEFPFDMTLELAETLDLSMCLDTGHVLCGFSGPVDLFDALEQMLPRLAEIHLHDAPAWHPGQPLVYGKDHQALGTGDLDLGRLLDRLMDANYQGPVILEQTVDRALISRETIRQLRPELLPPLPG